MRDLSLLQKTLFALIALAALYVFFVGALWVSGACPRYVNFMPGPGAGNSRSLPRVLYVAGLCPLSEKVW